MKKMILTTATMVSLGVGLSNAGTVDRDNHTLTTAVASGDAPRAPVSDTAAYHWNQPLPTGPNPWNGTESWRQWNRDHPAGGGGSG
jgi:hypothetical protein